jgi:hypothetical protein
MSESGIESTSGGTFCWIGIFTPQGKLVKKIESEKRIYHCTEVIDPKSLEPGVYHVVIQQQEMIMIDSLTVPYSGSNEKE